MTSGADCTFEMALETERVRKIQDRTAPRYDGQIWLVERFLAVRFAADHLTRERSRGRCVQPASRSATAYQPPSGRARSLRGRRGHSPNGSRISRATITAITLVAMVITRASVPWSIGHS